MSTFNIDDTILSQYGASERIKRLLRGFHELIKPDADIKLFYDNVFHKKGEENGIYFRNKKY